MIVIVFGVSGAGKTTIGKLLAEQLGWRFYEGDDFHPRANIEKMRSGRPLTDEDRWPWLERLREQITQFNCCKEERSARLLCVETCVSRSFTRQRRREVCVSSRRSCAYCRAAASKTWSFHEPGVTAKPVCGFGATRIRRRCVNERIGADTAGACRRNQNETTSGAQRFELIRWSAVTHG